MLLPLVRAVRVRVEFCISGWTFSVSISDKHSCAILGSYLPLSCILDGPPTMYAIRYHRPAFAIMMYNIGYLSRRWNRMRILSILSKSKYFVSLIHSSTRIIIEALVKNCNISSIKSKVSLYILLEEFHSINNSDVTASRTRNKIYQQKALADPQSLQPIDWISRLLLISL
jgi:hypothetical protein